MAISGAVAAVTVYHAACRRAGGDDLGAEALPSARLAAAGNARPGGHARRTQHLSCGFGWAAADRELYSVELETAPCGRIRRGIPAAGDNDDAGRRGRRI